MLRISVSLSTASSVFGSSADVMPTALLRWEDAGHVRPCSGMFPRRLAPLCSDLMSCLVMSSKARSAGASMVVAMTLCIPSLTSFTVTEAGGGAAGS